MVVGLCGENGWGVDPCRRWWGDCIVEDRGNKHGKDGWMMFRISYENVGYDGEKRWAKLGGGILYREARS